jgi:hypothetical protein
MVSSKSVVLTFPVNTTQMVNYVVANYYSYNIFFPLINSTSQLGTEIIILLLRSYTLSTAPNVLNNLYIGAQTGNLIYNMTSGIVQISAGINYVNSNQSYYKFVAFQTVSGQYGWLQVN